MGYTAPWYSARDAGAGLLAGRGFGWLGCYVRDDGDHVYETYWTTDRGNEAGFDLGGGRVGIPAAHPPDVLASDTATPPDSLVDLALASLSTSSASSVTSSGWSSPTRGGTVRFSSSMVHPSVARRTRTACLTESIGHSASAPQKCDRPPPKY